MDYVERTPDKATKIELIKTLQSVTEGKVSVLVHVSLTCTERCKAVRPVVLSQILSCAEQVIVMSQHLKGLHSLSSKC